MSDTGIDLLENFGFVRCGKWIRKTEKIDFEIETEFIPSNVLYAFGTSSTVGYIGISGGCLDNRLRRGYAKLVSEKIEENLINDNQVYILYYSPDKKKYNDIELDMIKALEYPLQKKFKTQWTTMGYGGHRRLFEPFIEEMVEEIQAKL